ncbi:MAG TPA: FAD-dependent oxidoreductase [Alphaproteobacteria bacterium]|nr:FAD-dependent oxidoreductase [Alphaproteobacteria bacterium]
MLASPNQSFVIVGAGQAGGRAAEAMRKAGFQGRVILIGDEAEPPYERPPLSKAILVGAKPHGSCQLLPSGFYKENEIELLTETRVIALDPAAHRVKLADGREVGYDKLVLATGGRVRELPFAPIGRAGVYYLRTVKDSLTLGAALRRAKRFVVIGGGFLGLEAAASARKLGLEVTVVECLPAILDRAMHPKIAEYVAALHRRNGVEIRTGITVSEIASDSKVEAVICRDGSRIAADLVLVAIGILPNVELAEAAGAAIENGIKVDEFGRTTLEDVYAVGDVANHPNPILGRRLRLESWQNAQNQAIAVARGLCGAPQPYAEVPWFWSDQYDANIQMVGVPQETDDVVFRGDPTSGRFTAFNIARHRVVGATAFNMGGEIRFARKMIETGTTPTLDALADPRHKLKDLVAAHAASSQA